MFISWVCCAFWWRYMNMWIFLRLLSVLLNVSHSTWVLITLILVKRPILLLLTKFLFHIICFVHCKRQRPTVSRFETNCIYSVLKKVVKTCFRPFLRVWQYTKYRSFKQTLPLVLHCGGSLIVYEFGMCVEFNPFFSCVSLTYLIEESRKRRPPVLKQVSLLLKIYLDTRQRLFFEYWKCLFEYCLFIYF